MPRDLDKKRAAWRNWYNRNKHDEFKKIYFRRTKRTEKALQWIIEFKSDKSCVRCGFSHPAALDFHHRDPSKKDFSVASFRHKTLSIDRIKKEIEKCDIICANCHRIEHFSRK